MVQGNGLGMLASGGLALVVGASGLVFYSGLRRVQCLAAARSRLNELIVHAGGNARVVITGATSGIGLELARQFARHPSVSVLVGCRDIAVGRRLFSTDDSVRVLPLELLDFDSVESFSAEAHTFLNGGSAGLRMLFNNAGVMKAPVGSGGTDSTAELHPVWKTNFLSPFLLTELLAIHRVRARSIHPLYVVDTSSRLERRSKLDVTLLDGVRQGRCGSETYSDSKRAVMLWTSSSAQRLNFQGNMFMYAATPGMVDTQLGRHSVPRFIWPLTKPLRFLMLRSPAEGALGIAAAGLRDGPTACSGRYYDGERELENLVVTRESDAPLASELHEWASQCTDLQNRSTRGVAQGT